jgi:hypothetical protein
VRDAARTVIVGRHSRVWQALERTSLVRTVPVVAIGHREVAPFRFQPDDRVWILSYSRVSSENAALIDCIARAGVAEVVYVTSASTNVLARTRCYEYPRVKHAAAEHARRAGARVAAIGVVYDAVEELPAGCTAATSIRELAEFIADPVFPADGGTALVFRGVDRPFRHAAERRVFAAYGVAIGLAGKFPCVLRPFDVLLRAANMRWYGYLYLSNRLWFTTTS